MIRIRTMIDSDDYSELHPDFSISFNDFLLLTDTSKGKYGIYEIAEKGVSSIDVGDLKGVSAYVVDDIYVFNETAKLDFPTTAANLVEWVEKQNGEFNLPTNFIKALSEYKVTKENKSSTESIKKIWVQKAKELGTEYMDQWRNAGYEPTVANIALYVEGVFSNTGVYNSRIEVIDKETIIREALTGITGKKAGYKSKKPKIPTDKVEELP